MEHATIVQEVERRLTRLIQANPQVRLKKPLHAFAEDNILSRIFEGVRICEASGKGDSMAMPVQS